MTFLKKIIIVFYEKILLKGSHNQRINYLRKLGIKIGNNCLISTLSFSTEPYLVEIGDQVRIAGGTQFITHDGSLKCFQNEIDGEIFGQIKIGNNVFIGSACIILLNTTIGDNCIIGAGSVVRGNFPENSVIFGNPAQVVLNMNIQKMLFRYNSGLVKTENLSATEKNNAIKKHFGIK